MLRSLLGGSDWIDFTEPVMNLVLTNLSKDAIVIDRLVIGGYTAPAMVLLDDDLLSRAAQLGSNMVNALLNKQNAQYQGPKGVCPGCHCNVIVPQNGLDVTCAFCKSRGKISIKNDALVIYWDKQSVETHRFTKQGEVDHQLISHQHIEEHSRGKTKSGKGRRSIWRLNPL